MYFVFYILIIFGCGFYIHWTLGLCLAMVFGYFKATLQQSIILGFWAGFISWFGLAYYFHFHSSGYIGKKLSLMLNIPWSPSSLVLTGVLAGLSTALFSLSGYYLKSFVDECYKARIFSEK